MNARAYAETLRRFRAKHCPPPDAFAAVPRHGAPARPREAVQRPGQDRRLRRSARDALLRSSVRTAAALALVGDTTVVRACSAWR
jgi:hypothetical protein